MGGRTTVAFVFVDLVGSTELLHRLGDAANSEVSGAYMDCLRAGVARHGGIEVRSLGDGLAAAFPGALSESVACAIDLARSVRRLGRRQGYPELSVRVGLSVGEAASLDDGGWTGAPIVEAARLVESAKPGRILVTDVVSRLVGAAGDVHFDPVGALPLKGFPDPVECCEIEWDTGRSTAALPFPAALDGRGAPPLVGRRDELSRLLDAVRAAWRDGEPRLVMVEGARGSGRRRLGVELARLLDDEGEAAVVHGRGQLVLDDVAPLADAVGVEVDPVASTSRDLVADVVHGIAEQTPVLVVVEAPDGLRDDAVVTLTRVLAGGAGVAVVVAGAVDPVARDRLQAARAEPAVIELGGLTGDEVGELLARAGGGGPVDDAVVTAVAAETGGRPGRVIEAAARLGDAGIPLGDDPTARLLAVRQVLVDESPYKGLLRYEEADAGRFYGREGEVADLLRRVQPGTVVAVVGPSGTGKSSLVRAGLVPALRAAGADGARANLVVRQPGHRPLAELAFALADGTGRSASDVLTTLEHGDLAALLPLPAGLVIVIDQLEELFTLHDPPGEVDRFLDVLLWLGGSPERAAVVLVLRADFFAAATEHPGLAAVLASALVLISSLTDEQLRTMLEAPALAVHLELAPGLADVVLHDIAGERGALPLLSHALYETWRRRDGDRLTLAGYREAGGVQGAIAESAESIVADLDAADLAVVRRIFLALVEPGDGMADARRRAPRTEVAEVAPDAGVILERLIAARLLTTDDESVQLAHEALIGNWPRLRGWVDADRERLRARRRLSRAAHDWQERDHDPADLYRGSRLADTIELTTADPLPNPDRAFLDASIERQRAEQRDAHQGVRRLRRLLAATAIVLVIALVAGTVAIRQRDRADQSADAARAATNAATINRLVAESERLQPQNRYLGALLAVQANRLRDDAQTRGAMFSALLQEPRRVATVPTGPSLGAMPVAGTHDVVTAAAGRLEEWNLDTRQRVRVFPVHGTVDAGAVTPDGRLIAAKTTDGTISFFDRGGHSSGRPIPWAGPTSGGQLAFSPDGTRLAAAYTEFYLGGAPAQGVATAQIYDVARRAPQGAPLGTDATGVSIVAFSSDGKTLATGDNAGHVMQYDATTGAVVSGPVRVASAVFGLSFVPGRLAIGQRSDNVIVVDTTTGAQQVLEASGGFAQPSFGADGRLAVVSLDGLTVFERGTLAPLSPPASVQTGIATVGFVGDRIVVSGLSGPMTVWQLDSPGPLFRLVNGASNYVFPMVGDELVAAPDLADSVTLFDRRDLQPTGPPLTPGPAQLHPADQSISTAFAASYYDGSRLAVVNRDGVLQLFDSASRRPIGPPVRVGFAAAYAVFSRDMHQIAVGGRHGELALVDVASGTVTRVATPFTGYVLTLEYGPDGRLWAGDVGHLVVVSNVHRPHPSVRDLSSVLRRTGPVGSGDLSPDGRTLAVIHGVSVGFHDAATMRLRGSLVPIGFDDPAWLAYSRDGRTVVVAGSADNRLIDVGEEQPVGPVLQSAPSTGPVFSHDSHTLGTSVAGRGGALLSVDPAVWREQACLMAGRNLTVAEWHRYLPTAGPPRRTCPQYPLVRK